MKIVFIGGGSMRTLPVARGAMGLSDGLAGGEINLVDLNTDRAAAMAQMLAKAPEYARVAPRITYGLSMAKSLAGADAVSVTMPAGDTSLYRPADQISRKLGFMSSDQLSPTGAMLALQAGPKILGFAREMEKHCPKALLFIFANPVAVYSGMVNNHTKIKAMGICGGYTNHMSDLSRLMGEDRHCNEYDVEVAGINHLSFIVRGRFHGEDLYEVLGRYLHGTYTPPHINKFGPVTVKNIQESMRKLAWMYRQFGQIIFSTEGDGMAHLFYEEFFNRDKRFNKMASRSEIQRQVRQARERRRQQDADFATLAAGDVPAEIWSKEPYARWDDQAAVRILVGLSGKKQKVVTSYLNNGAIEGFSDRTVVEYSQTLQGRELKPYGRNLAVHPAFQGLISSLATHQTLLGDAIATEDPKTLFHSLFAYPIFQNSQASRTLYKQLLTLHKNVISPKLLKAKEYFQQ